MASSGAIATLVLCCCTQEPLHPESWLLADGRTLAGTVREHSSTAVLVIDPGHWHECNSVLAEWLARKRSETEPFLIILSRLPNDRERSLLRLSGIEADGAILQGGPSEAQAPVEILFQEARTIHVAYPVAANSSPLLRAMRERSLTEIVARPENLIGP